MRVRLLTALLLSLGLLATACGDDGEEDVTGEEGAPDEISEEDLEDLDLGEPPELGDPVDLQDGVAAVVDGADIATDTVEERFETIATLPEVAEQLEGEESTADLFRAQIVQNLILQRIVADGADELGVEPSNEDVAAVEEQAMADFEGDQDEWDEMLEAEGVTDDDLRFAARIEAIREAVAGDLDDGELEQGEELGLDAADLALQQWFGDRLAEVEVQVDEQYGIWNPQSGEVVPSAMVDAAG